FSSIHRYEKLEIHKVFLRFPYLDLPKNLSPSTLVDLIRASLIQVAPHDPTEAEDANVRCCL
ncbi:MAG: hypothetical protein U0M25_03105, partial [Oscillospiraceae bacterium]|nr:hypothetical protein [Oscillospiraceae bacterium]